MLYETAPFDPVIFIVVSIGLLTVAVVARVSPAWRVARLDSMQLLRTE
jgi:ABC-type lipoprotein release transport system permease subunit